MIHSIVHFMVSNRVFTLFICLAIGFLIGNYKIAGKFNIGATVGTLIVTLIVGQVGSFPRDEMLGTIFFGAFMFSVGYRIGPQLLVSLDQGSLPELFQEPSPSQLPLPVRCKRLAHCQ